MTSVLNVDTIADKAGTGPVGLTKQNTIKVFYVSDTTFGTADNSFGLSSSSDAATGYTNLNFTNAFENKYWALGGTSFDADGNFFSEGANETTTSAQVRHFGGWNSGGTASALDADLKLMFTGDLA